MQPLVKLLALWFALPFAVLFYRFLSRKHLLSQNAVVITLMDGIHAKESDLITRLLPLGNATCSSVLAQHICSSLLMLVLLFSRPKTQPLFGYWERWLCLLFSS